MRQAGLLLRLLHIVLGLYLLSILGVLWIAGITAVWTPWLWPVFASLAVEGAVLIAWKGRCPVTLAQEKHGDDKGFFGLFLPRFLWPWVIPFFTFVALAGVALVLLRCP